MPPTDEKENFACRTTREGKKLTYVLKVLQQPERARACGAGAKCMSSISYSRLWFTLSNKLTFLASADRRPVDPPPVVELRIFEDDKTDITFSYNANFFLFATLEAARPIAQGRVPQQPASLPVLTGMPVAGMAYLDRPSAAGYFIFPDLSVRHEGRYRLAFNLYEEVKEAKDEDADPPKLPQEVIPSQMPTGGPGPPSQFMHGRLEVKSQPFTVYSAKKFPGLAESTSLSRIVAEQGCRVRIRRDVRMRRRDNKGSKEFEEYGEDAAYTRARATPDPYPGTPQRARSSSHGSMDGSNPFRMDPSRRPSHDSAYGYPQPTYAQQPPPVPIAAPQSAQSHLSFGPGYPQQYQAPALPVSQQAPPQNYPPLTPTYQYQQSPQMRQLSGPPQYPGPSQPQYQQPQYSSPARYDAQEYRPPMEYRRASQATAYYPPQHSSYSETPYSTRPNSQSYKAPPPTSQRVPTPVNSAPLPPITAIHPEPRQYHALEGMAPIEPAPAYESLKSDQYPSTPTEPSHPSKRTFGQVFNTDHTEKPLHSGMRPATPDHRLDASQIECEDESYETFTKEMAMMVYRRANGSMNKKKCPTPPTEV